jgi:hypothetical protein
VTKGLHLCVIMSDSYFPIYQKIFNRTLPAEFTSVNILHLRDWNSVPGAVGERNFKMINYKRLELVYTQMKLCRGDNLMILDIDAVCFQDFKGQINKLLENNDMVFQHNPHYKTKPYCIATWGLQCNEKNINFFENEVLPRAESLRVTKEMWSNIYKTGRKVPGKWFHHLDGKQTYYDGDACVINAAILETKLGQQLKVKLLPDTYTQESDGGQSAKNCVLYQSAGEAQGVEEKISALTIAYDNIKRKMV